MMFNIIIMIICSFSMAVSILYGEYISAGVFFGVFFFFLFKVVSDKHFRLDRPEE
jgi:hypothetical protein